VQSETAKTVWCQVGVCEPPVVRATWYVDLQSKWFIVFGSLVAFCILTIFTSAQVMAAERLALVIGNSDYVEITSLPNPRNDAEDVADRLQTLGFKLYAGKAHHNMDERSLLRLISDFAAAADDAEIALLYFAGHGMQFNGDPHLLPVDIPDDKLDVVKSEAISLNSLLAKLEGRAELTIAIFDACREIPDYEQQIRGVTRGGSDVDWRGLSRPRVQLDSTLIAYSGGSGELVAAGDGRNSPYTEQLLSNLSRETLQKKRLDVPSLFAEVSYQFRIRHNGQRPEVINLGVRPNYYYLAELPLIGQSGGTPTVVDSQAPIIYHEPSRSPQKGLMQTFSARVVDQAVTAVYLHYRDAAGRWQQLPMRKTSSSDTYLATVDVAENVAVLRYYVSAVDAFGNVSQRGDRSDPLERLLMSPLSEPARPESESATGGSANRLYWVLGALAVVALIAGSSSSGGGGEADTFNINVPSLP